MKDTRAALAWIVALLRELGVLFRIEGGLAARVYGSSRELADIDIGVPADRLDEIAARTSGFAVLGPERYKDAEWDLRLLTLEYRGQLIDIAALGEARYFDKRTGAWRDHKAEFVDLSYREYEGVVLPLISKQELVAYKEALGREVDTAGLVFLKGLS